MKLNTQGSNTHSEQAGQPDLIKAVHDDILAGSNDLARRKGIDHLKAIFFLFLNITSGVGIVFANKAVFQILGFNFIYALAFCHAIFTFFGMSSFCMAGLFVPKRLPFAETFPLAGAFVGYILFWNLSLKMNSIGFYQLSKVMIMPTVVVLEVVSMRRRPSKMEQAAIAIITIGVAFATITDPAISANLTGALINILAVVFTSTYQVWAGSKQKKLEVNSMQLMHQSTPWVVVMLGFMVACMEPVGIGQHTPMPDTLLGFKYTWTSLSIISCSAILGMTVSLSTFLAIAATSSVTYNVVAHLKLVIIMAGSVLIFEEQMSSQRLLGLVVTLAGIAWFSYSRMRTITDSRPQRSLDADPKEELVVASNAGKCPFPAKLEGSVAV